MRGAASYREGDIMHENGRFWVLRVPGKKGCYQVLRTEVTHSIVRGTFHFSNRPDYALARAIEDCDKRASGQHWAGDKA